MLHALLICIREQSNVNCIYIYIYIYIGIANVDLQLSKEPVLGKWLIKANVEVQYMTYITCTCTLRWVVLVRTCMEACYLNVI